MKHSLCLVAIFAWLAVFFAPASGAVPGDGKTAYAANAAAEPAMAQMPDPTDESAYDDDDDYDYDDEPFGEERVTISDPLEPVNRIAHVFNDRMYFWVLKPAAVAYKAVAPEPVRISVKNLYSHLGYPARFLSCLLQADFAGAAGETGRFVINTLWGIGGLMDPAAGENINLQKQDTDLGETLGVYGAGHGFYIVWPVFGPSSPRDSANFIGDFLLYPTFYLRPWYASTALTAFEYVNSASLRIGEYESLVDAAIDPYVAMRNAYVQYRMKGVKARQARSLLFKEEAAGAPEAKEAEDEN
jgi:phospholipid-binding lipoprotein MlaA